MQSLLILFLLCLPLIADRTLTITWNKVFDADTVEAYIDLPLGDDVKIGSVSISPFSPPESMVITITDHEVDIYVIASNQKNPDAVAYSDKSKTLTIPTKPTMEDSPILKLYQLLVQIETSSNLTDWKTLAYMPLISNTPSRFIRASITNEKP